jgi:hypothetical protein
MLPDNAKYTDQSGRNGNYHSDGLAATTQGQFSLAYISSTVKSRRNGNDWHSQQLFATPDQQRRRCEPLWLALGLSPAPRDVQQHGTATIQLSDGLKVSRERRCHGTLPQVRLGTSCKRQQPA